MNIFGYIILKAGKVIFFTFVTGGSSRHSERKTQSERVKARVRDREKEREGGELRERDRGTEGERG